MKNIKTTKNRFSEEFFLCAILYKFFRKKSKKKEGKKNKKIKYDYEKN